MYCCSFLKLLLKVKRKKRARKTGNWTKIS